MRKHLLPVRLAQRWLLMFLCLIGVANSYGQTNVTGTQSGTWTKAKSPYIINGTVTIPAGQKLTIEAGVEVRSPKFDDEIQVYGILKAIGIATDSIRFNGFANAAYNANSTHGGLIYINSSNLTDSTVFAYTAIDRMGDKDYWTSDQAALEIGAGKVTIRNSVIRNSEMRGIFGYNTLTQNPVVTSNTFINNPVPVYLYANNVSGFSNNTNAAITLRSSTVNSTPVVFPKPGSNSYYIMEPGGQYAFVDGNVTIQPGVEIRSLSFDNQFSISGSGVLKAIGTATDSIRFTGFANTAYAATSSHGGLIFLNSGNATDSSVIAYTAVDRMGDKDYFTTDQAALELGNGKITIRNCNIRNSEARGIFGYNQSTENPIVASNIFLNNPLPVYIYANNVGSFSGNTNAAITLRGTSFSAAPVNFPKPGTASYYIMEPGGQYAFTDVKVTIQPGAEFRSMAFDNQLSINGAGVLIARGTVTDSIRFTGYANTAYSTSSTHGGLIYFNSSNISDSSVLAYAAIDRMGDKDYFTTDQAALELGNGKITIRNCTIRNSEARGIFGYNQLTDNPIVASNIFINNPVPVYIYANNAGSFSGNVNAAITLHGTSFSDGPVNFPKPGTASYYIMEPGGQYAFTDVKVTIQPGAEFRSMAFDNQLSINGTGVLIAKGSVTDSIRFTGYPNTAYSSSSTHGGLIYLNSTSTSDSSVLGYCAMDRMGDKDYFTTDQAALEIGGGKINVSNSSIRNSENRGIFGYGSASGLTVRKSNLLNNRYGGDFTSGTPLFFKCNIVGNTVFGINNQNVTDVIDARTCWWGDSTGPKQTATNPNGKGNAVSLRVLYKPFLLYPYQNNDIGIDSIYTPVTNCGLSAGETVKVRVRNYGSATQTGFNISYKINNASVVTENVGSASIVSDSTMVYSFTTKANLSTGGGTAYKISAFTALSTDTMRINDTTTVIVVNNKPMLGADSTVKVCPGFTTSIRNLYNTTGYTSVVWSAAKPDSVSIGTYTLIVTNSFGCRDTAVVTVAANPKPALGNDSTVKICAGSVANVKVLYNTTGYTTATWSIARPDSITAAGNYTLIVSNSFGCKDTAVATVALNAKPNLGKDTTVSICAGSAANITALYNTSGYASVSWSTARPDSVTAAGNYTLIVTNSFGCKDTAVVAVTAGGATITANISTTNAGCFGGNLGSIKVMPTNGTAPYLYKNGINGVYQSSNLFKALQAGNYTVYVQDAKGCAGSKGSIIITQYAQINTNFIKTNPSANGAADGNITVTASGGKPPYQYRLGTNGIYGDGNVFSGLKAGNYVVYVKDVAGCTVGTITITLTAPSIVAGSVVARNADMAAISLAPNPSSSNFMLRIKADKEEPVQVRVLDMNGRVMQTMHGNSMQPFSFGNELANGLYLVEVTKGKETTTLKAIKLP